jgi:predicted amidohydrolase
MEPSLFLVLNSSRFQMRPRPGNVADIGIFEIREGKFEFVDSRGPNSGPVGRRVGHQKLVSKATVCHGELLVNASS